MAATLEPQTIEDAKAALARIDSYLGLLASARCSTSSNIKHDIFRLKRLISDVEAAQPTQSEREASFHFGG